MVEAGFFETPRLSPSRLGIVIVFHGALILAVAAAKLEVPLIQRPPPLVIDFPKPVPDPKPVPTHPKTHKLIRDQTDSHVDHPPQPFDIATKPQPPIDQGTNPPDNPLQPPGDETARTPPPHDPIRIDAQLDPRFADRLQPPYPASQLRDGIDGIVRLKIVIGTDGRVKGAEKLFATNDEFYRAAERQALREWRFKPATVDGKPVETSKVMSVRFELNQA